MEDTMETLHITSKGKLMATLEKYYIFREADLNNQINDKLTVKKKNTIFDTIVHYDHHRGLPNVYTQDRQQPASVAQDHHSGSQ